MEKENELSFQHYIRLLNGKMFLHKAATTRTILHSNFTHMMSTIEKEVANVLRIQGTMGVATDTGYQIFDEQTYSYLASGQNIVVTVTPTIGKRTPTPSSWPKLGLKAATDESRPICGVFKFREPAMAVPRQMLHSRRYVREILQTLDARLDELQESGAEWRMESNAGERTSLGTFLSAKPDFKSWTQIAECNYNKTTQKYEIKV